MKKSTLNISKPNPLSSGDNFKRIHGIGPAIEKRLHAAGILTYAQLAATPPEELAPLFSDLTALSAERIAEKNWNGQARNLIAEAESSELENQSVDKNSRQHYAVFMVELLLGEQNTVRRTRVTHVQSQAERFWAGWDEANLFDFFSQSADLHLSKGAVVIPEPSIPVDITAQKEVEPANQTNPLESGNNTVPITGELRIIQKIHTTVPCDQPFNIPLTLDLSDIRLPPDQAFACSVVIHTKKLGSSLRQILGKVQGKFIPTKQLALQIPVLALPQGHYRIEALVSLATDEKSLGSGSALVATVENGILPMYCFYFVQFLPKSTLSIHSCQGASSCSLISIIPASSSGLTIDNSIPFGTNPNSGLPFPAL